jgi:hypothetical protein
MSEADNGEKFCCAFCGHENPWHGLTEFRTEFVEPVDGDCPTVLLCEVCANSRAASHYLVTREKDSDAVDRAFAINLLRSDIQRVLGYVLRGR